MQPIPTDADIEAATLKIGDLTDRFRCSRATVYRWINERGFPKPVLINPRVARWKPDDITTWARDVYPSVLTAGRI